MFGSSFLQYIITSIHKEFYRVNTNLIFYVIRIKICLTTPIVRAMMYNNNYEVIIMYSMTRFTANNAMPAFGKGMALVVLAFLLSS